MRVFTVLALCWALGDSCEQSRHASYPQVTSGLAGQRVLQVWEDAGVGRCSQAPWGSAMGGA